MAIRPPPLPPPPPHGNTSGYLRPPLARTDVTSSRSKPFFDVKGEIKTAVKTSAAVGHLKALGKEIKNIHSFSDAYNAANDIGKYLGGIGFKKRVQPNGADDALGFMRVTPDTNLLERADTNISPSSVDTFIAQVKSDGLAKSNRFNVIFSSPKFIGDNNVEHRFSTDTLQRMTFYCEMAEFPGRSLNTVDSRIYGATYKTPTLSTYQEVNFTLLCDRSLEQKKFFDVWMEYINPTKTFDFSFRDDYTSNITINQYTEHGDLTYACTLMEAFPTTTTPMTITWSDDQYQKIQVTMCYRYWVAE